MIVAFPDHTHLLFFQVAVSAALINDPTPQNSEASRRWILLDLDIKERRDETSYEIKLYWMNNIDKNIKAWLCTILNTI